MTTVGAEGTEVVVPTITPASIVAEGHVDEEATAALPNVEKVAAITANVRREYIVVVAVSW